MNATEPCASITALAATLQNPPDHFDYWREFERAMASAWGYRLFTALVFDADKGRMRRVHSNRPDISAPGGAKAVTDSAWTRHVLREGKVYIGSTPADIRAVFSEHALLAAHGCDSVLNIPVRKNGITIGTLNLLHEAGHYDAADTAAVLVVAQLAVAELADCLANLPAGPADDAQLEYV